MMFQFVEIFRINIPMGRISLQDKCRSREKGAIVMFSRISHAPHGILTTRVARDYCLPSGSV